MMRGVPGSPALSGGGVGSPISPALSGGGVGSPFTPVDEPAEVEQLRKALARQVRISELAGQRTASVCRARVTEPQCEVCRGGNARGPLERGGDCSRTGHSHTVLQQECAPAAVLRAGPSSAQACADHSRVVETALAGQRPRPPGARTGSTGVEDVTALAAHLDEVLSTAAWGQAAPMLKNIEWLAHPTLAKQHKATRRGAQSSRRRRARKKQAGERKLPVSAASSRKKPQCRESTGSRPKAK